MDRQSCQTFKRKFGLLAICLSISIILSLQGYCLPRITSVSGFITDKGNLTIYGSDFGNNPSPEPLFFDDFEDDPLGEAPEVFIPGSAFGGVVSSDLSRGSGTRSLKYFYNTSHEEFKRNLIDIGQNGSEIIYISMWVLLNRSGTTTNGSWQWKNIYVSSEDSGYTSFTNGSTCAGSNFWWSESEGRWFNVGAMMYYNGLTPGLSKSYSLPPDTIAWEKWQRLEFFMRRSSNPGQKDAVYKGIRLNRTGSLFEEASGISHIEGDRPWRYVSLGQAVASVVNGRVLLAVYYDNLYIDDSWAHVLIGNNQSYGNCSK